MNPASASMPAAPRQVVNDISRPARAPAPSDMSNITAPNIVSNIPVHNPGAPAAVSEDDELDKIMRDVGHEMKNDDKKPHKAGFLSFLHKPKPAPNPLKIPVRQSAAYAPQPAPQTQASAVNAAPGQSPQTQTLPQTAPVAAKPKQQSSTPVFVVFLTILAVGFLSAAAIAAYRQ